MCVFLGGSSKLVCVVCVWGGVSNFVWGGNKVAKNFPLIVYYLLPICLKGHLH